MWASKSLSYSSENCTILKHYWLACPRVIFLLLLPTCVTVYCNLQIDPLTPAGDDKQDTPLPNIDLSLDWLIFLSAACICLTISNFKGYKTRWQNDKLQDTYLLPQKNCSKANIIHLFRLSLKNSTQNKNKINIKHRLLFSFLRSVLTSQDEVFCFRSDSLFSSAYILNVFWRPCLCCITQRVGITIFFTFISYL